MKLKTALLTLACLLFMAGMATASPVHIVIGDIEEYDYESALRDNYGFYTTGDGSTGQAFGQLHPYGSNGYWTSENIALSFRPNTYRTLHFEEFSATGIVLNSLVFHAGIGTYEFNQYGQSSPTLIAVTQAPASTADFVDLYGDLIDYSLGGILSITFKPADGAWPDNHFYIYSMGYGRAVPLPSTVFLLAPGLAVLAAYRRNRRA